MKMGENYCHFAARNLLDNWTIYNLQLPSIVQRALRLERREDMSSLYS